MSTSLDGPKVLLAIRLRGPVGLSNEEKDTLLMLNLPRSNYATILPNTPSIRGMLRKVNSYVTWGEPDVEVLSSAMRKRLESRYGRSREEVLKELGVDSFEDLARRVCEGVLSLKRFKELFRPYMRLHPPKGGFKGSIKRPFGEKGEYGYRGRAINDLLKRMI